MASKVIENFIKMALFKKGGAIASDKAVKFSSDALEKRLINLGIDPNSINNQTQLKQLLAYVKQAEDQQFNQLFSNVLSGDDAANFLNKAFPKKGEVIPFKQKRSFSEEIEAMKKSGDIVDKDKMVISEKITDRDMFKDASKRFSKTDDDLPPPGSRGGKDDIAAPFQSSDESLKNMIEAENKKNIAKMKNRKMVKDAVDNASPGFVKGDRKYNAQMVAEDLAEKKYGKEFYDLDQKQQADLYGEALDGLSDDFAQGGRAGYYTGGITDVEPSLDDIGHGSDSLMARTRLMSPGSQATTSTGLNYLLAEDNDNIRVPFKDGLKVYPKIMASKSNEGLGDGKNVDLQDLTYGGTLMYDKGPLSAGIEYLKGKDKFDFKNKDDTIFKDTTDRELANLILMMKLKNGLIKFKGNKDNQMINFSKSFADGGRIGFAKGTDLSKRAFLRLMAALTGGAAAFKSGILSLGGKGAAKKALPAITTPNAPGKPAWFDSLVTRVITEGDDVTRTMSTKEREIVFKKKIDDETEVIVTQDLDNSVTRVDIDDSVRNVTGFDDPPTVSLQVTDEIVEEGGVRTKPKFEATENDYRNYATDPDGGYETEFVENTVQNTKDLTSDLTKIKSFATKKGPTMKEIVGSKKRKDNVKYAKEQPSSYAADRGPQYDPTDYIDDMADDMAAGGRAGFSTGGGLANVLARLGIKGSSSRFLEKVFGKEGFKEMTKNDPDMYRGLLEVVEMFRNRDKEGLKSYMKNFLPDMDDTEIEQFIIGSAPDIEGLSGQLTRLGSGRDYSQKLQMMKKADEVKKLQNFDIKNVTKNAEGGRIGMMFGNSVLKAIIRESAKKKGISVTEFLRTINPKAIPPEIKKYMTAADIEALKKGQGDYYQNLAEMMKTRKAFQDQVEGGKTTPAKPLFENMEKIMDEQSYVPKTVSDKDIGQVEQAIKNKFFKDRKPNASGGIQTMLGE